VTEKETKEVISKKMPTIKEVKKTYTEKQLLNLQNDLLNEAKTLFAGSTDADLMCRKINDAFKQFL